jgi:hypothetical protein
MLGHACPRIQIREAAEDSILNQIDCAHIILHPEFHPDISIGDSEELRGRKDVDRIGPSRTPIMTETSPSPSASNKETPGSLIACLCPSPEPILSGCPSTPEARGKIDPHFPFII